MNRKVHVFIVSDATGFTAEMVISAVLLQFTEVEPVFKKFPYTKTKEQIMTVLNLAKTVGGIVTYSLVAPDLRRWIRLELRNLGLLGIDILGPHLDRLGKVWNVTPTFIPGRRRRVSEQSILLAEAIDFTLRHDDGQGMDTIHDADLVMFGVSRTSKTPTSLYLSCNYTLKVANVPIIEGMRPPDQVFTLQMQKIGLTIDPERLAFIRARRMKYVHVSEYLDVTYIQKELEYSHRIFQQIPGIQIIDVTNSSIEEVASRVIELRQERGGR